MPFAAQPDEGPFYEQPADFPDTTPGAILKSREIALYNSTITPAPLFQAWQLQYVSHDIHGKPIANVTTIAINRAAPVTENSPVVSYQYAYNSLGASCTPSRLFSGTGNNTETSAEAGLWTIPATALGWVMVFPDHQGPEHAYGVDRQAGPLILYSLPAALKFEPAGLSPSNLIGFWGYSAGGAAINMVDIADELVPLNPPTRLWPNGAMQVFLCTTNANCSATI